jgi:branched-chain amino acid transport system permease protein
LRVSQQCQAAAFPDIIGLVLQISALFLPIELQSAAIFVVLVATLFVKPEGIFGRNVGL